MVSPTVIRSRVEERDGKSRERTLGVHSARFTPLTKDMRFTLSKLSSGYVCAAKATQSDNKRLPLILTKDQKRRDGNGIVTLREHDGRVNVVTVVKQCVLRSSRVL